MSYSLPVSRLSLHVRIRKLVTKIGCHYTTYRPCGKPEHFLKIGDRLDDLDAVEKPKNAYSVGGVLEKIPLLGVHLPGIRTKVSRRLSTRLIDASTADNPTSASKEDPSNTEDNGNKKGSMTICITELIDVVKKEIMYASRQGYKYTFTQRADRMLRKAAADAIKSSLQDLFDAWVEGLGELKEKEAGESVVSNPAIRPIETRRLAVGADGLMRRLVYGVDDTPQTNTLQPAPLITPPVDLTEDVDERDIDIVLTHLKEQTILQNLLHKQVVERNQRVLFLEHKNGRKLRVFVPPDSHSSKAFVDDTKKTRWINDMLYTDAH